LTELLAIPCRPLQVVAHDLVQLDQVCSPLVQPAGKALMQLRSHRFGQGVICRIPDQEMPEAVGLVARELCSCRPHQLLAHQRHQFPRYIGLALQEHRDGIPMEHAPFDGPTFQDAPLRGLELVQPGRQERLGGGRDHYLNHRPVSDPLPIEETAASHDPGVLQSTQELPCQPRLADACGAQDGKELG